MRFAVPVLLLVALLLVVAAFDSGHPRAEFVYTQPLDNFTLDPVRQSWTHDLRLTQALYEPLVVKDAADRAVNPGVAQSWECSADGRTWTFHLRPDARWSNGDPVRAQDFVYAWRRAMLPDSASDYAGFLFNIQGAEEFFQWRTQALAEYARQVAAGQAGAGTVQAAEALWQASLGKFDEVVKLRAVDDRTLTMTLRTPVHFWLDLAAFAVLSPVHPATHARFSRLDPATGRRLDDAAWTKAGNSVTNGPMRLADWRYKRQLRLERNPYYWNPAAVGVETIDVLPIEDNNTAVLAYEAGAVDWVTDVRVGYRVEMAEAMRRYLEHHRAQYDQLIAAGKSVDEALAALPEPGPGERRDLHVLPAFGTDFFNFNCRPTLPGGELNPFSDARVRRAFTMAVDKQALSDRVVRIGDPVSRVLVPPGSIAGYEGPQGLPHDTAAARAQLKAAGWEDRNGDGTLENAAGAKFPTVEVLFPTDSVRYRGLSLALADMWRRELGVPVEVRGRDSKFVKDDLRKGNFMIARGGWYGDYEDPTTFLEFCRTGDGNNDRGYSNPVFDQLLDSAERELDPAARMRTLAEAERILVDEDLPLLPLSRYSTVYLYDPVRVHGIARNRRLEQHVSEMRMQGAPVPVPVPEPVTAPEPVTVPAPG